MNVFQRAALSSSRNFMKRGEGYPPVKRPWPPALSRPSTLEFIKYSFTVEWSRWIGRTCFVLIPGSSGRLSSCCVSSKSIILGYLLFKPNPDAKPPVKVYPGQWQDEWHDH